MTLRPKPFIVLLAVMVALIAAFTSIAAPFQQGPVVPTRRPTQTPTATTTLTETPTYTATQQATSTATNTATPATPIVEAVRAMTIRGGPGSGYPDVATLEANSQLDIIGISEDGAWYQVALPDGSNGWISSSSAIVNTYGDLRSVPLALPPTSTPTETETNTPTLAATDTPTATETATTVPTPSTEPIPIEMGATVQGSMTRTVFEVRYTFEGQAGEAVDIRMNNVSGNLDPLVILLDPDGQEAVRNDDDPTGFNRDSHIANFRLPVSGTYTIIATRFQQAQGISEGAFSLTLSEGGAAPPTPVPPTLPPQTGPGTIAYGDTVTGNIQGATAEVRYTFTAQAGDVIDIRMNNTSGDLDPLVILYGPSGQELARDDDSGGNFDAYLNAYSIPTNGVYTIAATRFGISQGSFSLTLTRVGGAPIGSPPPPPTGNVLSYGQMANGTIGGANSAVRYTFNGQAGDQIEIRMNRSSGDLDPLLILLGPNGQETARDDDGGGSRNAYIRSLTLPASGVYTIVATRFGEAGGASDGNFSLTLTSLSAGTPVPPLPTGSSISYGQTVQGNVPPGANAQVTYTFNGQSGDVIEIRMNRGAGELDPLLILLGPNGQEVARDDDGGGSRNAYIRSLTLPASGVYTIAATKFGTAGGDFTLTLTLVTAGSAASTAQGDGSTLAFGIPVTGSITASNPEVSYTFAGEVGQLIGVRMAATSGELDTLIVLRDPDGREVADNDDDELGKNLGSYLRDFELPASGVYTVIATRFQRAQGDSTGDFELVLVNGSDLDRPLTTYASLSPEGTIAIGDTISGTIDDTNYVRLYAFEGNAGQTITFHMVSTVGSLDTYLLLLAPDGREIARNDDGATNTIDATISGVTLPETGTYTIVATRYLQQAGNSAGDFELGVLSGGSPADIVVQEIAYNSTQNGTINDQNYMYVYTFQGDAGDVVNIELTPTSGDLLTLLFLTDTVGNILAVDFDLNSPESSIQSMSLPEDSYYSIVALRYRADIGRTTGNFQLELSGG